MNSLLVLTFAAIVLIVLFDYTNGFHDASNIVATVIASRAMMPAQAVTIVAVFEFLGPLLGGTAVANTMGSLVDVSNLSPHLSLIVITSGIVAAIAWNLFTWWLGIPSSSSHALVGGLVGAVVVSAGAEHVLWGIGDLSSGHLAGVIKVVASLVLSPIAGFVVGFVIHRIARFLLRAARPSANKLLRRMQFVTAAGLAFSHGANDAQKSMGILTMVLVLSGFQKEFHVPLWVVLLCATAITLGIMSGGWRIVRTVGFGIYKVRPLHAVDAQLTSALVIFAAAISGGPVSTTHVVSSSIMGIGTSERPKAVRWAKAKEIVSAWIITMPGAAAFSIATYWVLQWLLGSEPS